MQKNDEINAYDFGDDRHLKYEMCQRIIYQKAQRLGPTTKWFVDYSLFPVKTQGRNGQYHYIRANLWHPSPPQLSFISFFVKISAPKHTRKYNTVCNLGLFDREVALYTSIFPEILHCSDLDIIPECFYGVQDNFLILDDMHFRGFKMVKRFTDLDFNHCKAVLETLATFHARSIIWEEKNISMVDKCDSEDVGLESFDDKMQLRLNCIAYSATYVLEVIPEFKTLNYSKFKLEFLKLVSGHFEKLITIDPNITPCALCHCDLLESNILFRYNLKDIPIKSCILDFQYVRYTAVAYDLHVFLYANTTNETREKNTEELLKTYYQTVCSILESEELDPTDYFPGIKFAESLKEFKIHGLIRAILNMYFEIRDILIVSHSLPVHKNWKEFWMNSPRLHNNQWDIVQRYKHRIVEAFLELYNLVMT